MSTSFSIPSPKSSWHLPLSVVVTAALWLGLGATSASAASALDAQQIEAAIANATNHTVMSTQQVEQDSGARVSTEGGLSLPIGDSEAASDVVTVKPVTKSTLSTLSPSGFALFANTETSAFALSSSSAAGYSVSFDENAPTSYSYEISAKEGATSLELSDGGGVSVLDADGNLVNSILPPWAKDATGADIATHYTISGNVLTQHVEHRGATYPVVADPRFVCSGIFCTLELSRGDTQKLANNVLSVGGACALLGPAGPACAAILVGMWGMAKIALSTGQCVGVRGVKAPIVTGMHGVYIPCYA
jgi:hypothetical protein